jgi:hypothetical protein
MSRALRRRDEIARICALREVVTRRAEHHALERQRALRDAVEERDAAQAVLVEALGDWDRALARPGFDPQTIGLWADAINDRVDEAAQCDAEVAERSEALSGAQGGYHRAIAEERCADALWRRAYNRVEREREEHVLAERDDETTRKAWLQ